MARPRIASNDSVLDRLTTKERRPWKMKRQVEPEQATRPNQTRCPNDSIRSDEIDEPEIVVVAEQSPG